MHRQNVQRPQVAVLCVLALVAAGCAAPGVGVESDTEEATAYPDWVRIVPEPSDTASYYVGMVPLARDVESGVEAAEADAMSQVLDGQRQYFADLFKRAADESGIETARHMRLEFLSDIADEVSERLGAATRQDGVFYRPCEHDAGLLCEVYVLLRLQHRERDPLLESALAALRQRKLDEDAGDIVPLIDWMLENR